MDKLYLWEADYVTENNYLALVKLPDIDKVNFYMEKLK